MKGGPWFWARLSIQELYSSGSLPGFTATILVSLSGAARAFVIRLWHKFILLSSTVFVSPPKVWCIQHAIAPGYAAKPS
jgi:hypothetical protein